MVILHTIPFLLMALLETNLLDLQCESKNPPLRFSEIFSQTVGNF